MQVTARYIKMCAQAQEIQELWQPTFNDFYWKGPNYLMIPEACNQIKDPILFDKIGKVWLPTQEQLQALAPGFQEPTLQVLTDLKEIYKQVGEGDSWIEFWLKVVMLTRWNKVWDYEKGIWQKTQGGKI